MNNLLASKMKSSLRKWLLVCISLIFICIPLVILAVTSVSVLFRWYAETPIGKYGTLGVKLTPGITLREVEDILSGEATHTCEFGGFYVRYWDPPKSFSGQSMPNNLPTSVADKSEIPYVYAAPQMLFLSNDVMVASTSNGETHIIRTILGDFKGQHFEQLPDDVLAKLKGK